MDKIALVLSAFLVYKILDAFYKRHCRIKSCDVEAGKICVCGDLPTAEDIIKKYKQDIEDQEMYEKYKDEAARKELKLQEALENARRKQKEKYLKQTFKAEAKQAQVAAMEKQTNAKREANSQKVKKEAKERAKKGLPPKTPPWRQPARPKPPKRVKPPKKIYPAIKLDKRARQFQCMTTEKEHISMDEKDMDQEDMDEEDMNEEDMDEEEMEED